MATYSHPYKVLFHQVDMHMNTNISFQDLLRQEPKDAADRHAKMDGTNYEMEILEEDQHTQWWYGSFIKVRMRELPQKFSLTSHTSSPLDISDDEGIAEPCTFMYVPENNVLLTFKSQYAPYLTKLGEYLESRKKLLPIIFNPILKSDALDKFTRMHTATRIEVKTASLQSLGLAKFHSAATLLDGFKKMGCTNISLILTGDKKEGLKNGVAMVKELLESDSTETLKITGYGSDPDKTDFLDLLEDRLVHSGRRGTSERSLTYQDRKNILHEAYMAHRSELT